MLWLSIQTSVLPFPPVKRIDPDKANAARMRIIRNQRMYEFKLAFKLTLTILLRLNLGLRPAPDWFGASIRTEIEMKIAFKLVPLALTLATPLLMAAEKWDLSKLPPASDKQGVTYADDIRPLFEENCFRCHGEEKQKGKLRLDSLKAVLQGSEDGKVVIPGDSKKSVLVVAVARIDEEIAMPPMRKPRGPGGPEGAKAPAPQGGEPDGQGGTGGANGQHGFGAPPKPLTPEQVGLIRAWIDQGAK